MQMSINLLIPIKPFGSHRLWFLLLGDNVLQSSVYTIGHNNQDDRSHVLTTVALNSSSPRSSHELNSVYVTNPPPPSPPPPHTHTSLPSINVVLDKLNSCCVESTGVGDGGSFQRTRKPTKQALHPCSIHRSIFIC